MWWSTLDEGSVRPTRRTGGDPIFPLKGKSHGERWAPQGSPAGPSARALNSPPKKSASRPSTAGAVSSPKKSASRPATSSGGASRPRRNARPPARPSSAPALLRGDFNLSAGNRPIPFHGLPRDKELGDFRQQIENKEVRRKVLQWQKESHLKRDKIEAVDVLSDTTLFDLKVKHNSAQRARSAAAAAEAARHSPEVYSRGESRNRRRRQRDCKGGAAADLETCAKTMQASLLQDLADELDGDTKATCQRLGLPHKYVQDPRLHKIALRLQASGGTVGTACGAPAEKEDSASCPAKAIKSDLSELKSLFGQAANSVHKDTISRQSFVLSPKVSNLVSSLEADARFAKEVSNFILKAVPGSRKDSSDMLMLLEAMDAGGDGRLSQSDFEAGLELLGFSGDTARAWRLLNEDNQSELTLQQVQSRLDRHRKYIIPIAPVPQASGLSLGHVVKLKSLGKRISAKHQPEQTQDSAAAATQLAVV